MPTPTAYTPTSLTANVRALESETAEEENISFVVGNLASPNSVSAARAAIDAISTVLAAAHPGWDVVSTIQYTGRSVVYTLNGDDIPAG